MKILIRAVISGFGLALGAALFRKVSKQLGLEDEKEAAAPVPTPPAASEGDLAAEAQVS
jgi:hypothetical protein